MKVLLADDDGDQLAIRSMLLAKSGIETLQARDATTALSMAASGHPDCALVDLRLPSIEAGLHLIRELKRIDKSIRIFVLTGAPKRFADKPERSLVDDVLVKGCSSAELIGKLKSACTGKSDAGSSRRVKATEAK